MASKLDMSLDEIKKLHDSERRSERRQNKPAPRQQQQQGNGNQGRPQGQGRSGRQNPLSRSGAADGNSSGPIRGSGRGRERRDRGPDDQGRWQRDAPRPAAQPRSPGFELQAESRVLVENLARGISEADLQAIFDEHVGQVKAARLFFDSRGVSSGTGEVVFSNAKAAHKAATVLNAAEVEGRAMYVKVVADVRAPAPSVQLAGERQPRQQMPPREPREPRNDRQPRQQQQQQGGERRPRQPRQPQQQGGRGPRREQRPNVTAEDLDSQLDAYAAARGSSSAAAE